MNSMVFTLLRLATFLLCATLVLTSCERDTSGPTFLNQGEIGPEGGTVKAPDGATVEIPVGALTLDDTISITLLDGDKVYLNESCKVYEFEPNGIVFSDSVTISLPFDDRYLNTNYQNESYGISVMVFQDSTWIRLKAKIDLTDKTAKIKTLHFSTYAIESPSSYSKLYFDNKGWSFNKFFTPYYFQEGNWCAFYSVSMITKYAGYDFKGPYYAKLMGKGSPDNMVLIFESTVDKMQKRLKEIGIETEIKHWNSIYNLCGYIMHMQSTFTRPIAVFSRTIHHAIVVSGYDETGFFINDPSNSFLLKVNPSVKLTQLAMYHVPYGQFIKILNPENDASSESTMLVMSSGDHSAAPVTLNFKEMIVDQRALNIMVTRKSGDENGTFVGRLDIDGKYEPSAYSIVNIPNPNRGFEGTDYIYVRPYLSYSFYGTPSYLFIKIDGTNVLKEPKLIEFLGFPISNFLETPITTQLVNLRKGNHKIKVELQDEGKINVMDSWVFDIKIENESSDKIFNPIRSYGTVTDVEKNTYRTIQIGSQTWMAENLRTTKFNDGTSIPQVTNDNEWMNLKSPAFCFYDNDTVINRNLYGALYNWWAVDTKKLCPDGWHVPSDEEWRLMVNLLGGSVEAGRKTKETSFIHWVSPNLGATNESGFTALPGGMRNGVGYNGFYGSINNVGCWWAANKGPEGALYFYQLSSQYEEMNGYVIYGYEDTGYSIRCIKD